MDLFNKNTMLNLTIIDDSDDENTVIGILNENESSGEELSSSEPESSSEGSYTLTESEDDE